MVSFVPGVALLAFALVSDGGRRPTVAGSVTLVVLGCLCAGGIAGSLENAARSARWRFGMLSACSAFLFVPLAVLAGPFASWASAGRDQWMGRMHVVVDLSTLRAWSLLVCATLIAGMALGLAAIAWRDRSGLRGGSAALALLAATPLPILIVTSSGSIDLLYSCLRWGPVGFAIIAVVWAAATHRPSEPDARNTALALLFAVTIPATLAAAAFAETSLLAVFPVASVTSKLGMYGQAVEEETHTFALRLTLAWLFALFPWLLLGTHRARTWLRIGLPLAGAALLVALPLHVAVSQGLGSVARRAPFDPREVAMRPGDATSEDAVRAHAVRTPYGPLVFVELEPGSVTPVSSLLMAARSAGVQVRFLGYDTRPEADEIAARLPQIAPRAVSWFEVERVSATSFQEVSSCEDALDQCLYADRALAGDVWRALDQSRGLSSLSIAYAPGD